MGLGSWLFKKLCNHYTGEIKNTRQSSLCDFSRVCREILPGDVLLIEGNQRISKYIKSITHSIWTHASIYIGRLHSIEDPETQKIVSENFHGLSGDQLLVDTLVGQGTFIRSIKEYEGRHIRICRPVGISPLDVQKVIRFVVAHVGHCYNTRHFFDLACFLITNRWFVPRRWRTTFLRKHPPSQTTEDICSVMIAEAFLSVEFPILPVVRQGQEKVEMIHRDPQLFTPTDFDYSPFFSIIKYPLFHYDTAVDYKDLPWRKDLVSQDGGVITPVDNVSKSQTEKKDSNEKTR